MPELPDLQVFSHNLTKKIVGKTVEKISVPIDKKLNVSVKKLKDTLEGQKLTAVERVGKELHFTFRSGDILALHLMLRGKLHLYKNVNDGKFTVIDLQFSDGSGISMGDFQKAATPTLNPEERESPDALSDQADFEFYKAVFQKKKSAVKSVLLDQNVVRGIGNAYADEILWDAKISPFSVCNKIPEKQIKALAKSIRSVLKAAEKSILKSNPDIVSGEVRDFMNVHNHLKTHSPTGSEIIHSTTGGRKTYYTEEQELFK